MSHPPCTGPHAMRITFERRRSDFERDARVTPFTGSCCCCCCCLHWIGAAVGGIVGMRTGWSNGEKSLGAPLPAEGQSALHRGLAIGIFSSIGLFLASLALAFAGRPLEGFGAVYLIALAFLPPVVFLPVCIPMLVSAYGARRKALSAYRTDIAKLPPKDGSSTSMSLYRAKLTPAPKTHTNMVQFSVFCRHCWYDLGESMHLSKCPECSQDIDHPVISGPDYGVSVAWRAATTSIGLATGGTVVGYVLMLVISLFLR
ncbi:MAG: hypothetical protein ABJE95_28120 [Byssovorax sp.]